MNDDTTIAEAKAWLREHAEPEGTRCPCCHQRVQIYHRKLNSNMAYSLVVFYRRVGTDWGYKPDVLRGVGSAARDESLLRYWGLWTEDDERREDGGRAGWWRLTGLGVRFVHNRARVLSHARVYNGRCYGLIGEPISIHDALGARFDYDELMNGAGSWK